MYTGFLHLHDTLRWILFLIIIVTLIKYLYGWLGSKSWGKEDNILGIVFTSLMDLQLLVGLVLYVFLSPVTKLAFADFGAAMKDPGIRFFAVEHIAMMIIALVLVHIGRAKTKKARTDVAKFKNGFIFFMIATIVIVAAIPWNRM
jgi:uncharacterized membrane protein